MKCSDCKLWKTDECKNNPEAKDLNYAETFACFNLDEESQRVKAEKRVSPEITKTNRGSRRVIPVIYMTSVALGVIALAYGIIFWIDAGWHPVLLSFLLTAIFLFVTPMLFRNTIICIIGFLYSIALFGLGCFWGWWTLSWIYYVWWQHDKVSSLTITYGIVPTLILLVSGFILFLRACGVGKPVK